MKCAACGSDRVEVVRRDYEYDALPGVVLKGLQWRICSDCGDESVAIPAPSKLNRHLVEILTKRANALLPAEIRFIRKYLGWSGSDFAHAFGVTPETVSRWENGKARMGGVAERLLRVLAVSEEPVASYVSGLPERFAESERSPTQLSFADDWSALA
jgi:putative zinc finger/helix-turn-helix YgiT family protein